MGGYGDVKVQEEVGESEESISSLYETSNASDLHNGTEQRRRSWKVCRQLWLCGSVGKCLGRGLELSLSTESTVRKKSWTQRGGEPG